MKMTESYTPCQRSGNRMDLTLVYMTIMLALLPNFVFLEKSTATNREACMPWARCHLRTRVGTFRSRLPLRGGGGSSGDETGSSLEFV